MNPHWSANGGPVVDGFGVILVHVDAAMANASANFTRREPPGFVEGVATLFPIGHPVDIAERLV